MAADCGGKGNVRPDEKLVNPWGVDDESAGLTDGEVVVGDGTTGEVGEGKLFGGREVGLLREKGEGEEERSTVGLKEGGSGRSKRGEVGDGTIVSGKKGKGGHAVLLTE